MKTLNQLIPDHPNHTLEITSVCVDSRQCQPGALFVAIKGTTMDGHNHIADAIERGAVVVLCQETPADQATDVAYIQIENTRTELGPLASRWHDNPSHNMKVVGITGTNGKTTIALLLYQMLRQLGHKVGLISTVGAWVNENPTVIEDSTGSTPGPLALQELFAQMHAAGCTHVVMEVTSHAADQHRTAGTQFTGGIFTNITQDHLDYHKTFENYLAAKQSFFDNLGPAAWALANRDDTNGEFMLQNTAAAKYYYGLGTGADFDGTILDNDITGLRLAVNNQPVETRLIGHYNAYNLLAVYGAGHLLGESAADMLAAIPELTAPAGRFQIVPGPDGRIGIVDYAHTPDALDNVLQTINDLSGDDRRIITIIGCGGDRDPGKRPQMARIAYDQSTIAFFTSDNPRTEDPLQILDDMKQGLPVDHDAAKVRLAPDRRETIRAAVDESTANDIILVAGKGHEDYQEINGTKHHFDDLEELTKAFQAIT